MPVGLDDGVDEGDVVGVDVALGGAEGRAVGLHDGDSEGYELARLVGLVKMVELPLEPCDGKIDGDGDAGDSFVKVTASVAFPDSPAVLL